MKRFTLSIVLAAPSVVLGLTHPVPPQQVTPISITISPSTVILSEAQPKSSLNIDDTMFKGLEKETKSAEKVAKIDARKARVEKSRENFFEYEAKMAAVQEARIEAAEQKAIDEAIKDKKEFERLQALEKQVEDEASRAGSKQERASRLKEAKSLMKKEKEVLRKEKAAERAERVFLAEEIQEQKILKKKIDAASAEKEKFEKVEKEYEIAEKIAEEDEAELRLAKKLLKM